MKFLFGFYDPIPEFVALREDFPEHEFVFAKDLEKTVKEVVDADALFILGVDYCPELAKVVKEEAKRLTWIQAATVGVDDIRNNGYCKGVTVTKSVGIYDTNVAEQAVALLLSLTRQVIASERERKDRVHNQAARWEATSSIERKNIMIVGYGGIGKQTAKRLKAFDAKIMACDINPNAVDENADEFFKPEQFASYLPKADVVILTLPHTKENTYMMDTKEFELMKDSAILINVSRGKLVRESALVTALETGSIRAAGLDVFEEEPLPQNSKLWDLDNLALTPHAGGQGDYNEERLADLFRENIKRFLNGEELKNVVNWNRGF